MKFMMMVKADNGLRSGGALRHPKLMAAMAEYTEKDDRSGRRVADGRSATELERRARPSGERKAHGHRWTVHRGEGAASAATPSSRRRRRTRSRQARLGVHRACTPRSLAGSWEGEVEIRQLEDFDPGN